MREGPKEIREIFMQYKPNVKVEGLQLLSRYGTNIASLSGTKEPGIGREHVSLNEDEVLIGVHGCLPDMAGTKIRGLGFVTWTPPPKF